jgi:hypothetical protein
MSTFNLRDAVTEADIRNLSSLPVEERLDRITAILSGPYEGNRQKLLAEFNRIWEQEKTHEPH